MNQPSRLNNFDLMRLFGAILVIYGHAYPLTGVGGPGFAGNGVATIGVKIFFVISGYLITQSWLRDPNLIRFLIRRSVRIFPAVIVLVLVTVFVLGPLLSRLPPSEYFANPGTYNYLKNIVLYINYFLPGVFEKNVYPSAINGSLWSLPAEFFMYLLTPILLVGAGLLWSRRIFAIVAVIFVCTSFWLTAVRPAPKQIVFYATDVWAWLSVAPYFILGMLYAVFQLDRLINIYIGFALLFMLAVIQMPAAITEASLLIVLPYACLAFGLGYTPVLHNLTRGNDLSYGLFLYAFPVQQILTFWLGPAIGPWSNFLLATVICVGLAALSWHFVEKPALGWKPRRSNLQMGPRPFDVAVSPPVQSPPVGSPYGSFGSSGNVR